MTKEQEQAYISDPAFRRVVEEAYAISNDPHWMRIDAFVRLLYSYQSHLKERNAYLEAEVIRLSMLVTEPMKIEGKDEDRNG